MPFIKSYFFRLQMERCGGTYSAVLNTFNGQYMPYHFCAIDDSCVHHSNTECYQVQTSDISHYPI